LARCAEWVLILCETILEDGELTYDELYKLAEWLNNHPETCFQWPGNLLVAPLQNAWADGKITKTEARQLARAILQIRNEAAKREAEQAFPQAVEIASEEACRFDLTRPELPAIPFSTRVRSQTKRSDFYEVDLSGPTCTCPDFRSFRHRLRERHLIRRCKHIFDAYAQLEPFCRLARLARCIPLLVLDTASSPEVASAIDRPRVAYFQAA
jgi:hypothetical protein